MNGGTTLATALVLLIVGGAIVFFVLKPGTTEPSIFPDADADIPQMESVDLGKADFIQPLPMYLFDVNQDAYSPAGGY